MRVLVIAMWSNILIGQDSKRLNGGKHMIHIDSRKKETVLVGRLMHTESRKKHTVGCCNATVSSLASGSGLGTPILMQYGLEMRII